MLVFFTLLFNVVEARSRGGGRRGGGGGGGWITEMGIERAGKPGNLYGDIYSILITLNFTLHHKKTIIDYLG